MGGGEWASTGEARAVRVPGEAVGVTDEGDGELLQEHGFPRTEPQQSSAGRRARSSLEGSGRAWMGWTLEESVVSVAA